MGWDGHKMVILKYTKYIPSEMVVHETRLLNNCLDSTSQCAGLLDTEKQRILLWVI